MTANNYLTVPTTPPTLIPLGLSNEDFGMLQESIALWKPRINPPIAEMASEVRTEGSAKTTEERIELERGFEDRISRQNKLLGEP